MSDEFDGVDATEKAGIGTALNRCRALASKIANELRNKRPEHFVDKLVERFRPPELYPSRPAALWHLCLESPDSRSGLSFLRLRHAHVNAIGAQEWISCFRKPAAAHARDGVAPDLPFGRAEIPRRLGSRDFADVDDIKSTQFAPPSA